MKANIKYSVFLLLLLSFFAVPFLASADLVMCGGPNEQPCKLLDLVLLITRIINFLLGLSWVVAILFIAWGGFNMITAYGNQEGIAQGKKIFSSAVTGFFLILISFILLNWLVLTLSGRSIDPSSPQSIIRFLFP